jgi:hypothetical protein
MRHKATYVYDASGPSGGNRGQYYVLQCDAMKPRRRAHFERNVLSLSSGRKINNRQALLYHEDGQPAHLPCVFISNTL